MLKKSGDFFIETDPQLEENFFDAGFGFKQDEKVFFHPLEAAYLVKYNHASFEDLSLEKLLKLQKKKNKIFPFAFFVFDLIRRTGRIIRPYAKSLVYFRVYAVGVGREEERPSFLLFLCPTSFSTKMLSTQLRIAHRARLDLVIATGSKKQVKFYKISSLNF
jgi:tRNA splicing endonuclease